MVHRRWNFIFKLRAPLSKNQEVSAFGDDGAGDEMDIWVVTCPYQTVRESIRAPPNEDDFV